MSRDNPIQTSLPNILWICTDQQRFDTVGAINNPHIRTPNLERLVRSGVAFNHAYCQSPICTPSRASFLTGMYPDTVHGCINGNSHWMNAAPLVIKTLADSGYDCGLVGKLHLSSAFQRIEPRPDDGYRVFNWSHHPTEEAADGDEYIDWLKGKGFDSTTLLKEKGYIPAELHQSTWCADRAIDFMSQQRGEPWLCSYNCFAPHSVRGTLHPIRPYLDHFDIDLLPGPFFRQSDLESQRRLEAIQFQTKVQWYDDHDAKLYQAKYWALIELIDENVGRMLDCLAETEQLNETVVIFTSDHGEALGDHGLRKKGCRFFDGLVRVPLIISWPSRFMKNRRSDALVELTDIVPTLLDITGLEVPESMQGRSVYSLLIGESDLNEHRDSVRSVYYRVLQEGPQSYATMIRTRQHKLVNYHGHGLGELYDMIEDPGEFANRWDDPTFAEIRFELMTRSFDATAFAVDTGSSRIGEY